jgi:hypothetical protein
MHRGKSRLDDPLDPSWCVLTVAVAICMLFLSDTPKMSSGSGSSGAASAVILGDQMLTLLNTDESLDELLRMLAPVEDTAVEGRSPLEALAEVALVAVVSTDGLARW